MRRTGILIFTRGVIFFGGTGFSAGGTGFSGAEESVGDSSGGTITVSVGGTITVSVGGTITGSDTGTNTEKLPVEPPDQPPEETGSGDGVVDVTDTELAQSTITVSTPDVTVTEAVFDHTVA